MNVLVSSAGRRGALVRLIQKTVEPLGGKVFAVDAGRWSSASRLTDGWQQVPRCTDDAFIPAVLDFCKTRRIGLIVPTIDTELPVYAEHREAFQREGIHVAVSGPGTVKIGGDKIATHRFFTESGLPTVRQFEAPASGRDVDLPFPMIIKPRFGSSSNGVQVVEDSEALDFYLKRTDDPVVQELAGGNEFTVNFFVGPEKQYLSAVPHRRVETRGGEVSKGITVKEPRLMELAQKIAQALPDPWGAMCYQAFLDEKGEARIIEVNPRFGGGYPLAHQAGADFIQLLVDHALGHSLPEPWDSWKDGTVMLRWDDAVFTTAEEVGL